MGTAEPHPVVYVVDDDAGMRKSLRLTLAGADLKAECYASAEAFLEDYEPGRGGCMVLDLRMEAVSGLELFERMRHAGDHLPVIFLTGHGSVQDAVKAMRLGAFDFLEKPAHPNWLVKRVREALREQASQREREAELAQIRERLAQLTQAEQQVLDRVAEGKSSAEIAAELHRSRRTIDNHRLRLMRKMQASSSADLVRMGTLAARHQSGRPSN